MVDGWCVAHADLSSSASATKHTEMVLEFLGKPQAGEVSDGALKN